MASLLIYGFSADFSISGNAINIGNTANTSADTWQTVQEIDFSGYNYASVNSSPGAIDLRITQGDNPPESNSIGQILHEKGSVKLSPVTAQNIYIWADGAIKDPEPEPEPEPAKKLVRHLSDGTEQEFTLYATVDEAGGADKSFCINVAGTDMFCALTEDDTGLGFMMGKKQADGTIKEMYVATSVGGKIFGFKNSALQPFNQGVFYSAS